MQGMRYEEELSLVPETRGPKQVKRQEYPHKPLLRAGRNHGSDKGPVLSAV